DETTRTPYLGTTPVPQPLLRASLLEGCWSLSFTTTIQGQYAAPSRLNFRVKSVSSPAFTSTDGTVSGWAYGSNVYLKYQILLNGNPASGTVVAHWDSGSTRITGDFAATAFMERSNGAYGTVSGSTGDACAGD